MMNHQNYAAQVLGSSTSVSGAMSTCTAESSRFSRLSGRKRLTETQEAALLSQAASQAMAAARSILMTGGTEETALTTAKAAAQSVLLKNNVSDLDGASTSHSASVAGMGRRKAKRQAQIVASMALMSVKNNIGGSTMSPPAIIGGSSCVSGASLRQPSTIGSTAGSLSVNGANPNVVSALPPAPQKAQLGSDSPLPPRPQKTEVAPADNWIDMKGLSQMFPKTSPRTTESRDQENCSEKETRALPNELPLTKSQKKNTPRATSPREDPINFESAPEVMNNNNVRSDRSISTATDEDTNEESITVDSRMSGSQTLDAQSHNSEQQLGTAFDPFLYAVANIMQCGANSSKVTHQDMLSLDSSMSKIDSDRRKGRHGEQGNVVRSYNTNDDMSSVSVDTAEIVRELNLNSSEDGQRNKYKNFFFKQPKSKRDSMERVILRALSPVDSEENGCDKLDVDNAEKRTKVYRLRVDTDDGKSTAPTSLSKRISQKLMFRKWPRKRKSSAGVTG